MRLLAHSRSALLCEHAIATSLIAIVFFIVHAVLSTDEQVLKVWASGEGALIIFAAMHAWLTAPLLILLEFGYLVRRIAAASRRRSRKKAKGYPQIVAAGARIWPIVYIAEAAFVAATSDVVLAAFVNLKVHNNVHWLLYPWGVVALALIAVCLLRGVCQARSMAGHSLAVPNEGGPADRVCDWFGEAAIAATFSSLIVVVGLGWMHISDDPLTADLASIQPVAFAVAMFPIGFMAIRRGAIRAWRRTRPDGVT